MTFKNHHFLPRSIIPWIAFSLKIVFVKRRQKNTISARKFLLIVHFLSNYIQISLFCVWNITSRVENSELPQARGRRPPEKVAVVFFNYSVVKRQKPEKPILHIGFSGFICFVYKKSKKFEKNSCILKILVI